MSRNWVNVLAATAMVCAAAIAVGCCVPQTVVSDVPAYAYVGNQNDNTVSGYMVDNGTGALTPVQGSPFTGPTGPRGAAVELYGKYVYVTNGGTTETPGSGVYAFAINSSTGTLTTISGSPFAGGSGPRGLVVDSSGQYVYTANRNGNNVSGYVVNATTGVLTPVPGSPFAIPAEGGDDEGTQEPGPQQLTVDPTGRFLYVTNHLTGDITGFTINATTGALTMISGSPFSDQETPNEDIEPFGIAVSPSGQFVFVANHGTGTLSVFQANTTTGALTPVTGSPFPVNTDDECFSAPYGVAVGVTGPYVYVADNGCDAISVYNINTSTGVPTEIAGSPFFISVGDQDCEAEPNEDSVDPTGRFLYVADQGCALISAFSIDPTSGALTPVVGSPFPAGNEPYSVAISRIN